MQSHSGMKQQEGGAQLGYPARQALCLLGWAQRDHVCGSGWQGHTSATVCPCHGSCIGPLYLTHAPCSMAPNPCARQACTRAGAEGLSKNTAHLSPFQLSLERHSCLGFREEEEGGGGLHSNSCCSAGGQGGKWQQEAET